MDKYQVIGFLGEGSFGRVYKAKQNSDAKFVALKVISKIRPTCRAFFKFGCGNGTEKVCSTELYRSKLRRKGSCRNVRRSIFSPSLPLDPKQATRGRSVKELKGLRRECEIQRHLHHPNIIQMLDSFETENEIVVISEFAHKELNLILGKEGYLPEERVQAIVWDLVSALYYLHSHRVLHRDLKPQNILLDINNCAKLCDFGFARNMSTGTHVLTSIKGTPLYMAPELIEEQPYDHNADLWSLGCIIYELLVGAPPFCTSSILHLIRLIRHEQIQWPSFISENCISFLKGLLQKNPSKRLTWPEILNHPFVKGHILISEDTPSMPLTRPMSANTLQAKEQQRKDHFIQKTTSQNKSVLTKSTEANHGSETVRSNKSNTSKTSTNVNTLVSTDVDKKSDSKENKRSSQHMNDTFLKLSLENKSKDDKKLPEEVSSDCNNKDQLVNQNQNSDLKNETCNKIEPGPQTSPSVELLENESKIFRSNAEEDNLCLETKLSKINIHEDSHPIENEEWIVFLHRTVEEVIAGEMMSLLQPTLTNIIVSPLRNSNANPKVLGYVANLLSLPFVVRGTSDTALEQIKKVYLEVKLIPNLVYGSKLLAKDKQSNASNNSTPTPSNTPTFPLLDVYKSLTDEDLQALEHIFVLICYLVHSDVHFLNQFCDAVVILNIYVLLQKFLMLSKRKLRIVTDLIAVLTHVLRKAPENFELVDKVILSTNNSNEDCLDFVHMLRHSNSLLRERVCILFMFLAKCSKSTLESIWTDRIRETLEALMYDSIDLVRNAAEITVEEIKTLEFYGRSTNSDILYYVKSP